ncbi:MAG TPA: hypothetical protein QGF66_03565 [SAR86 cluster bacterium]|jgi:hypothetical protein|nr:hypothetical protein [SAR86 cluster bacterium]|tara:strand:+ start:206 stop:706 length:501 start_codon:yes stop_codon:yes gene_type:complete
MKKKISSNKSIFLLLILLLICSACFQNLPNNIYPNMLDLSFGFSGPDVLKTFETLGETGRTQYIYSSLILDTAFPIIYGLLFFALLLKLKEERAFILSLPLMAVILDLCENISISLMMSSDLFYEISESQIFISSALNQCKWVLCILVIVILLIRFGKKAILDLNT